MSTERVPYKHSRIQDDDDARAHHDQTHTNDEAAANKLGHGKFPLRPCRIESGTPETNVKISTDCGPTLWQGSHIPAGLVRR
jgi:hypothetical protein